MLEYLGVEGRQQGTGVARSIEPNLSVGLALNEYNVNIKNEWIEGRYNTGRTDHSSYNI